MCINPKKHYASIYTPRTKDFMLLHVWACISVRLIINYIHDNMSINCSFEYHRYTKKHLYIHTGMVLSCVKMCTLWQSTRLSGTPIHH